MDKETTEKQLAQAKHRLEEAQARNRQRERKERTRRLIQKGAILEAAMPETKGMELDELRDFLSGLSQRKADI